MDLPREINLLTYCEKHKKEKVLSNRKVQNLTNYFKETQQE